MKTGLSMRVAVVYGLLSLGIGYGLGTVGMGIIGIASAAPDPRIPQMMPVLPAPVTCGTAWVAGADAGVQVCDAGAAQPVKAGANGGVVVEPAAGSPGTSSGTPSYVAPAGGTFPMSTPTCTNVPQHLTSVGATAVLVPATSLPGRKVLRICNSSENAGNPKVKCVLDGWPVMGLVASDAGTPEGDVMGPGDCFPYAVGLDHVLRCISDTPGTAVTSYECS